MLVAASVIVVDQLLKAIVADWLGRGVSVHRWELGGRWAAMEYIENSGAAFGVLAGQPVLISALAIVVTILFLAIMRDEAAHNVVLLTAVGLVLGGSLGNLLDRLRLGYVIDYLAIGIWPKFNIADSAIVIGLLLMAWTALFGESKQEQGAKSAQADSSSSAWQEGNGE
ncbi:MAG: signal peptidase II [Thermomicrobiales bacterium]